MSSTAVLKMFETFETLATLHELTFVQSIPRRFYGQSNPYGGRVPGSTNHNCFDIIDPVYTIPRRFYGQSNPYGGRVPGSTNSRHF